MRSRLTPAARTFLLGALAAVVLSLGLVASHGPEATRSQPLASGADAVDSFGGESRLQTGPAVPPLPEGDSGPTDADCDGLADRREATRYGTDPDDADTDGDGLTDGQEVSRASLAGADPARMDVFLELDYMRGERPSITTVAAVRAAYAAAPVRNPDGSTGISLHVVLDEAVPAAMETRPPDLERLTARHFDRAGQGYHYGVAVRVPAVADVEPTGFGVGSRQHGQFVFLGAGVGGAAQPHVVAAALMHELGHSVGLSRDDYAGIDSTAVPFSVYPSSMNYNAPRHAVQYSDGAPFDDWAHLEGALYTPPVQDSGTHATDGVEMRRSGCDAGK